MYTVYTVTVTAFNGCELTIYNVSASELTRMANDKYINDLRVVTYKNSIGPIGNTYSFLSDVLSEQ